jgi:hypothetical protein
MKTIVMFTMALALLGGLASAQAPAAAAGRESPFACDRKALSPAERTRHFDVLGPMLRQRKLAVRELADGYEFQLPANPETIQLAAEWAAGERACCPFFDIDLRMEREGGAFWMRLTGRPGTKQFIREDFVKWMQP